MSTQDLSRVVELCYWKGHINLSVLAEQLGISRPTLYQALDERRLRIDRDLGRAFYTPAKIGRPSKPNRKQQ